MINIKPYDLKSPIRCHFVWHSLWLLSGLRIRYSNRIWIRFHYIMMKNLFLSNICGFLDGRNSGQSLPELVTRCCCLMLMPGKVWCRCGCTRWAPSSPPTSGTSWYPSGISSCPSSVSNVCSMLGLTSRCRLYSQSCKAVIISKFYYSKTLYSLKL